MKKQRLLLMSIILLTSLTRYGQQEFTVDDIKYKITSTTEVEIVDYTGSATAIEIPETVGGYDKTYTVTTIEVGAFRENDLTEVIIPDGVTSIGNSTFRNNQLTGVSLSSTVTSIGSNAFEGKPDLALVTVEATDPPSLHENAFADRGQIDLTVPNGQRQAYLDQGWDGFRSITEEGLVLTVGSNIEFRDFTLYPNPARDKVHIGINPGSGQALKQVNIYTMTGAYLYSESGPEINTGRLSEGMYLFEIVTQTGDRSMRRVIIQ